MAKIAWDAVGTRKYETGTDRGVLYIPDSQTGVYDTGVPWNGLTGVTQQPSGAEPTKLYADNIPYVTLISIEDFAATIEAYTYPDEFAEFDGSAVPIPGVSIGQQKRGTFGFSYRTLVGNDVKGNDFGYKVHLIYGCTAAPTEKAHTSVNDSPEAITLSWALATTPVPVNGSLKPTSIITVDSSVVTTAKMTALETILYGTELIEPRLPLPAEVLTILAP